MFQVSDLNVLAYTNNFTQWHYITEDSNKAVMSDNYFLKANDLVKENDLIIINASVNSDPVNKAVFVNKVTPEEVRVA